MLCLTYRDAVYPPAIYRQLILQTLHSQDFFPLSLPPSLSSCRDAQTVLPIQLQARGLPPAHALHTLTRLQVVLLGQSKFTTFPFSRSPGASVLGGGGEGGRGSSSEQRGRPVQAEILLGGGTGRHTDLAGEPAAPARPPMSLEVQPWPPHGAAHFPLGCGVAIFVAQG